MYIAEWKQNQSRLLRNQERDLCLVCMFEPIFLLLLFSTRCCYAITENRYHSQFSKGTIRYQ